MHPIKIITRQTHSINKSVETEFQYIIFNLIIFTIHWRALSHASLSETIQIETG
ncbi:MAG: hypothetical protein ACI8RD_001795 [Bacillariaceae sp.]|jgi:hypothetical protein